MPDLSPDSSLSDSTMAEGGEKLKRVTSNTGHHLIDYHHDPHYDPHDHHPAENEATPFEHTTTEQDLEKTTRQRKRAASFVAPETRLWKDDIVTFDTKDDPTNPMNWPYKRKMVMTMLLGLTTMSSTFASSVISPANADISREFGISTEVTVLTISLFVAGYIFGPVVWAPMSELYGRVPSVLFPVFGFLCFTAGSATATNVQTLMITRFFGGFFGSAPVTNVGGGLADMFDQRSRATAVVFYSLAVVAGPFLGPVIGGAVADSYLGWRWTEYLALIIGSVIFIIDLVMVKETFAPVLLSTKARKLRLKTRRWALHSKHEENDFSLQHFLEKNLGRPIKLILTEPMVLAITLYNSFVYGTLYLLFAAVPIIYEDNRGWNHLVGSLPFLAALIGAFVAAGLNIAYSQYHYIPFIDRNNGKAPPEKRLPPMMLGSIMFPIGFFLLGWTSNPDIHWFPSVLGIGFIGVSFLLVFQAGINFLLDAYPVYAASAVGANTLMRSIFAAALPLVAKPLFGNLGIDYACTLLGCLAIAFMAVPYLFYVYGPRLRAKSKMTIRD